MAVPVAAWPLGRLELGAFVAAGAVLVATAVVLGIRLLRDDRAGYRQIGVPPCSPTRRRPAANLAGSNGAMSTEVAAPSRISSAIPRPIAGAVLNPVPLWPQSR